MDTISKVFMHALKDTECVETNENQFSDFLFLRYGRFCTQKGSKIFVLIHRLKPSPKEMISSKPPFIVAWKYSLFEIYSAQ